MHLHAPRDIYKSHNTAVSYITTDFGDISLESMCDLDSIFISLCLESIRQQQGNNIDRPALFGAWRSASACVGPYLIVLQDSGTRHTLAPYHAACSPFSPRSNRYSPSPMISIFDMLVWDLEF